jgi:hypothetical protein
MANSTREIARDEWEAYFEELSDYEDAQFVTVELVSPDLGAQVVARDLALQGISVLEKGSGAGSIEISLGDAPGNHVGHTIASPAHVRIEESETGMPLALQIESVDSGTTLVHFRPIDETGLLTGATELEDDEAEEEAFV